MRRREFIGLVGGQQHGRSRRARSNRERVRRIGVLTGPAADDPEAKARMAAFLQSLQQFGWSDSRNVQIV